MLGQATGTLTHKTHHSPDSGEATTFPHIVFSTACSGPEKLALATNEQYGGCSFLRLLLQEGIPERQEAPQPPWDHRFHSKAKPPEFHDRADCRQDMAQRPPTQSGGPYLADPQQRAPGGHVAPNHGAPRHLQRLRPGTF